MSKVKNPYNFDCMRMRDDLPPQIRKTGEAVALYRAKTGFTQKQLAQLINLYGKRYGIHITASAISAWETRLVTPKQDVLWALTMCTHMPYAFFTGHIDANIPRIPTALRVVA